MSVINGNQQNFQELISSNLVIVDFFATWCGPCRMLGPILEEISNDRSEIKVVKIDVDENPDLAKNFGIMSVPTLLLFKEGKQESQRSGYMTKDELLDWINEI